MEAKAAFTLGKAAVAGFSALSRRSQALDEEARARSEAYLADTQALQRDTLARDDLTRTLSAIRAARGANGLSPTSSNARLLEREAITASDRDRIIGVGDSRQTAANYRSAASASRRAGRMSLFTGLVNANVPLMQYRLNEESR